ncbi:MAG: phosphatidylglycerophosphatase A [Puniceicoccales bacterium]|jgi:phosphatidylglycerophosphatase A|nr:phosphatidylglycerophosphatase A [Puniceicoccales bacterium]
MGPMQWKNCAHSGARGPFDGIFLACGTCAYSGFLGPAPGTIGAAIGTLLYPFTFRGMGVGKFFLFYFFFVVISLWICGRCERILDTEDPAAVNLDECVAMPLCLWPAEYLFGLRVLSPWILLPVGFLFFRFFDIYKPFFINSLQRLPGGWGIVLDDLAAAAIGCVCLIIGIGIWTFWITGNH